MECFLEPLFPEREGAVEGRREREREYVCSCVHVNVEVRGQPQVCPSGTIHLFIERGSFIGLGPTEWAQLDEHGAPGVRLSPPPHSWDCKHKLPCGRPWPRFRVGSGYWHQ